MRATENLQSPSSNNFNSLINSNRRSESCLNADNSKREIKRSDDEEGRWDDAKGQQSSMKNRSPYLILADRSGKCIAGLEKTPPAALLPPINFPEERTSQTLEPLNLVSMLHGACAPISDIPETALALETKNDTGYSTSSASTICQLTNETLGLSGLCSSISTNPASPYPFDDRTLLLETSDTQTDERNKRSVEHSLAEDSYVSTSSTQHPRRERSSLSGSYLEMMRLVDDRIQKQSESSSVKSRQSMREHEHLRLHKMSNFRTPSKNSTTNPPMNVQSSACNTPPPVYHAVWIRIHLPSGSLSDYIPAKKSALKEGMYVVEILPHSVYPIQACSVEVSSDTEEVDVVRIECLTADRTTVESFQYGMLES
ncbi:uncharacterized protein LOC108674431 [Hyalella azteca]|uniref:Uncharacterized protein LOC108674431 n=1 Tax=Hyalella azteca TaxID=294128 RepID=A0A8B7NYA9_HYAAZ|nr:uncharacterized protein LOC108674431 [Hyalella azteca]